MTEYHAEAEGGADTRLPGWMGRAALLGLAAGLALGIFWLIGG